MKKILGVGMAFALTALSALGCSKNDADQSKWAFATLPNEKRYCGSYDYEGHLSSFREMHSLPERSRKCVYRPGHKGECYGYDNVGEMDNNLQQILEEFIKLGHQAEFGINAAVEQAKKGK